MPGLEDFPLLVHAPAMTPALATTLAREREFLHGFVRLPFVALHRDHRWVAQRPAGVGRFHDVSPTMLGVLLGIDKVVAHGSQQRRLWAMNGNRWAWGRPGEVPYPMLGRDGGELSVDLVPGLLVPCTLGFPASLNLSIALRPGRVLGRDEPIAVATRIASRFHPVIVAAGNWGQPEQLDTLSPIARLPWCISVGATEDEDGAVLWPGSSVGSPDIQPDASRAASPSLVAWGENAFKPGVWGTSFAAPRVSGAVLDLTAFLLQVRATRLQPDGQLGSCPLLIRAAVDNGFRDFDPAPKQRLPMLPLMGIDREACDETLDVLAAHGANDLDPTAPAVTRLLLSSTRAMPGHPIHHVGAGFCGTTATLDRLLELTGLDYAEAMFPGLRLPPEASARLGQLRLAEPSELEHLLSIARSSALTFATDFKTLDAFTSIPPAEPGPRPDLLRVDPDVSFWPPSAE